MHMISKKDLSNAEMDTLTKSCSPTIVTTTNGEVQTHDEAIVYVKESDIFLSMKVLEDASAFFYREESFAMNTDTHASGSTVKKPHLIKKRCSGTVQHGKLRSDRGSWFINEFFLKLAFFNISMTPSRQELDHPTSSSSSFTSPPVTSSTVSSESVARQERGDPCGIDHYPAAVSSKHVERQEWGDPCSSEISEEQLLI